MNDILRIFISHKMPTDTSLAQEIGSKLALFGGSRVKVTHAGKFRYGENWRKRIQDELDNAHWLIFLYTDPDEDWGFCLFECGLFRHSMENNDKKRLITFCRKLEQVSDALKEFNAVVISEQAVFKLLESIYISKPWEIYTEVELSELKRVAKEIVIAFSGSERVEQNFDIATNVTIEMIIDESSKEELKNNRIPQNSSISGNKEWQRLFGREIDTGGWQWTQLVTNWPYAKTYEFLISKMIQDALESRVPECIFMKTPEPEAHLVYRMTLRRYEIMAGNKYRFYFTASAFDMPFHLHTVAQTEIKETVLFNLVNLGWYFRRRIVDQLYERILQVASIRDPEPALVSEIFDTLKRELMQISAQSIIRGIDNPRLIQSSLGVKDQDVTKIIKRLNTWRDLQEHMFSEMQKGAKSLHSVACDLYDMASINFELYRAIATSYALIIKELQLPPVPKEECL